MTHLIQVGLHVFLHVLAPGIVSKLLFPTDWKKAWIIMLATMLVDLDHLLAIPILDPCRCSIGFHPLHSYLAISIYLLALIPKPTRIIAVGLVLHMLTDAQDCLWMKFA
ncbi:MAG TPA: DUF6122 family protein [Chitinophagaceae bacterium]|nr:DUF6122 family protein [Chitinophagaceae bacterium]